MLWNMTIADKNIVKPIKAQKKKNKSFLQPSN